MVTEEIKQDIKQENEGGIKQFLDETSRMADLLDNDESATEEEKEMLVEIENLNQSVYRFGKIDNMPWIEQSVKFLSANPKAALCLQRDFLNRWVRRDEDNSKAMDDLGAVTSVLAGIAGGKK